MMITQEFLQRTMLYDAATGDLRWRDRPEAVSQVCTMRNGRMLGSIMGTWIPMARLVWLYVMGEEPVGKMAYASRDYLDNRIENLIDTGIKRESNHPRVIWDSDSQQWTVVIGKFTDYDEAVTIADLLR